VDTLEHARDQPQLTLLNAFELPVQDRPVPRDYVAGTLWIDSSEELCSPSMTSTPPCQPASPRR
jgi:hypothetical protein